MSKHTPIPWSVFPPETPEVTKQNCINRLAIVTGDVTVALFGGCSHQHATEEEQATAAFIVRACNAHDDLLDTLERIALEYPAVAGPNDCPPAPHACPKCEIYFLLAESLGSKVQA